jgi:hypothetical protein
MSWGSPWSPIKVRDRLIAAFEVMPSLPVYSPARGVLQPVIGEAVTELELLAATALVLGRSSPRRTMLLAWARAMARASSDQSVRDLCRANGWPLSTLYHRRDRSLELMAVWMTMAFVEEGLSVGTLPAQVPISTHIGSLALAIPIPPDCQPA